MRKREGKTALLAQAGALCGGRGTQFVRHNADDLQAALRLFKGEGERVDAGSQLPKLNARAIIDRCQS